MRGAEPAAVFFHKNIEESSRAAGNGSVEFHGGGADPRQNSRIPVDGHLDVIVFE